MRIRTIKPEFWSHHMHEVISETAALLAVGLLNYADDEGRFLAAPRGIECTLFPVRAPKRPVGKCLDELEQCGFIQRYTGVVDGREVHLAWIPGFLDHQVINKPNDSRLPPPPLPDQDGSDTGSGQHRSRQEGKGREGKGKEGNNTGAPPSSGDTGDAPAAATSAPDQGSLPETPQAPAPIRKVQAVQPQRVLEALRAGNLRNLIQAFGGNIGGSRDGEWARDLDGLSLHQVAVLLSWRRTLGMPVREPSGARKAREEWRALSPDERRTIATEQCQALGIEPPRAA